MSTEERKSDRQMFVYDLIYPAFLGAMLFEIVPLKCSVEYFIGLTIVIYYLLDFFHLYFYLRKRFNERQRNTVRYVVFDFFVSLLLFFSFRYVDKNLNVTICTITFVPLCFLVYASELKYRIKFYRLYFILIVVAAIIWFTYIPENIKLISALIYISAMTFSYGFFIFTTPKLVSHND